jgi:hypothetical protein
MWGIVKDWRFFTYQSEISYLGCFTSDIRKIDLEVENPLKLNDWCFVRYHNVLIQKSITLVNGRLESNPTTVVWMEVADFYLEPGEA